MATTDDRPITLSVMPGEHWISANEQGRVHLMLGLTEETNRLVEEMSLRIRGSKADVIRKALGLFKLSLDAIDEGKRVGAVQGDQELDTEFVGFDS
jgi:hypothetical protein